MDHHHLHQEDLQWFRDEDLDYLHLQWFSDEDLHAIPAAACERRQPKTAFANYSKQLRARRRNSRPNVHVRMMEFLKLTWKTTREAAGPEEAERERNHKHMMNERMRRVKQKQNYTELHKLLPRGTKGDKKSILQAAAERIEELEREIQEMKRRRLEVEEAKIKVRVAHPSSGIDSMLEVMNTLKSSGTNLKALQSNISSHEFSANLHIETKVAAEEVEKAVQRALYQVEKKFRL